MNLTRSAGRQTDAAARCEAAASFIHAGKYEEARDALGDLWRGLGERPETKGLKPLAAAESLLQCGVLSGWLGSVRQIPGAQDRAKDLISEAQRKFASQGQKTKVAECQHELGMCYFRLGAYDEARVVLDEAARGAGDDELKARALIRRAFVEVWMGRSHDALAILRAAQPFFEGVSDAIKGRWHGQMALILRRLATAERRGDYADRAIIEFTAAVYHFERAGHERYCATTLNNLAFLLYKVGRYPEAHEHLDRAVQLLTRLHDDGLLAQVNETRARVFLAEGKYQDASVTVVGAVRTFERGGERALLADALTIRGVALARLGQHERSADLLRRSMRVAEESGASSNAAHAALSLIEEHADRLTPYDLYRAYCAADDLLKDTQDAEDISRLRKSARTVGAKLSGGELGDPAFSLRKAVLRYEANFIERALEQARGSVTRASKLLGIGYQTLGEILKSRHKNLLGLRTPLAPRRRSFAARAPRKTSAPVILHVEDNQVVASAVKDSLELEGWKVETCVDGTDARRKIAGTARYDLLLLDYDLPGADGLELARVTRKLRHRRRTPIIMFSASDVETEAWRAGVDAFLRKPEDVLKVAGTVARLLVRRTKT